MAYSFKTMPKIPGSLVVFCFLLAFLSTLYVQRMAWSHDPLRSRVAFSTEPARNSSMVVFENFSINPDPGQSLTFVRNPDQKKSLSWIQSFVIKSPLIPEILFCEKIILGSLSRTSHGVSTSFPFLRRLPAWKMKPADLQHIPKHSPHAQARSSGTRK